MEMENQDLSKMSLEELNEYSSKLIAEYRETERKLKWATDYKTNYIFSQDRTIEDKIFNISNIINEKFAKYERTIRSKRIKEIEKQIDELDIFLSNE